MTPIKKINLHIFRPEKSKLQKERDCMNRDFSTDGVAHVFLDTWPRWLLILLTKELQYASTSKSITLHRWRGGHGEAEWRSAVISKCARKSGLCLFRSCSPNKTQVFFRTIIKKYPRPCTPVFKETFTKPTNSISIEKSVIYSTLIITYMLPYRSDGQIMRANYKTRITIAEMKFKRPTSWYAQMGYTRSHCFCFWSQTQVDCHYTGAFF